MIGSMALSSIRRHPLINPIDLQGNGKLFSDQVISSIRSHILSSYTSRTATKLERHDVPGDVFQNEHPRSMVYEGKKVYVLYRDHRAIADQGFKIGYLGKTEDGFVKLAQELETGKWFAARITYDYDCRANEIAVLRTTGDLEALLRYGRETYIFQTLFYGENAHLACRDIKSAIETALSVFRELESFHLRTGFKHADAGFHNFIFDNESGISHIIDFETTLPYSQPGLEDNIKAVRELCRICYDGGWRKKILEHEFIFHAITELYLLLETRPEFFSSLDGAQKILQQAYQRQFLPGQSEPSGRCLEMQRKIERIKEIFQARFTMTVEEFYDLALNVYTTTLSIDVDDLRTSIEEHKRLSLMGALRHLDKKELEQLPAADLKAQMDAASTRITQRLYYRKFGQVFLKTDSLIDTGSVTRSDIIELVSDFENWKKLNRPALMF
ncbi:MAG: hypothetical protein JSS62_03000 [Verrucomicrobia bacterium]|nr:hypothetical protein [Verrucomicrobiota bacterium]MBS0646024.1 hypothetical protein [Verrucomicrobiota bacterium]